MICYIITTSFGFIALNQQNDIVDHKLYLDNHSEYLEQIASDKPLDSQLEFVEKILCDFDEVVVETDNPSIYSGVACENLSFDKTTSQGHYVRENLDSIISSVTDFKKQEVTGSLNFVFNEFTSDRIRQSIKMNDVMIVESINSLEELEETTGKLIERLHEWCMPYLPELDKLHNHQLYAKLIARETTRENIKNSRLLADTNIKLLDTNNIEVDDSDLIIIKGFAESVVKLYDTKNQIEEYIAGKIRKTAPNLYSVCGANLAAKLIAHTNGIENLARLPSSTVQIIGAEKATFRHLKTGENPPKHGLIFQHPGLRGSNWWVRGKIARAIAGKISIAARKDAYNGDFDENLRVELDAKIDKIKKEHPFVERRPKKSKSKKDKKDKKQRKERGKKRKRNKKKLRKEDYNYRIR